MVGGRGRVEGPRGLTRGLRISRARYLYIPISTPLDSFLNSFSSHSSSLDSNFLTSSHAQRRSPMSRRHGGALTKLSVESMPLDLGSRRGVRPLEALRVSEC